jgi:hypothetical protein
LFPSQNCWVQLWPIGAGWQLGWHCLFWCYHLHTQNPAAPWHPRMQFVTHSIIVNSDASVSAFNLRLLKRHFGDQILKKTSIVNTVSFYANDHCRYWVLRLVDLKIDCSRSVFIHHLLVALR